MTGKPVGERHRWGGGAWGVGRCEFCGLHLHEVLEKPKKGMSLEKAIALGEAAGSVNDWRPSYWNGKHGIAMGWYIQRGNVFAPQWLMDASGDPVRCDSEDEAKSVIVLASTTPTN